MSRAFDSETACDLCGASGARDFYGGYWNLCQACLVRGDPDPTLISQLIETGRAEVER